MNSLHEVNEWMTELDCSENERREFTEDVNERYDKLLERMKALVKVNGDTNNRFNQFNNDVCAWLLLNFCSTRIRKHYSLETSRFRLNRELDGTYTIQSKWYTRFRQVRYGVGHLAGLIKGMIEEHQYDKNEKYEDLKKLQSVLYLYMMACSSENYWNAEKKFEGFIEWYVTNTDKKTFGMNQFGIKINPVFKKDTYYLKLFRFSDKGETIFESQSDSARLYVFESNGQECDIRGLYPRVDLFLKRYRSSVIAGLVALMPFKMNDCMYNEHWGGTGKLDLSYSSMRQHYKSNKIDIKLVPNMIDGHEKIMGEVEKDFEIVKDVDGMHLMFNQGVGKVDETN
jgi:hypothetical protein